MFLAELFQDLSAIPSFQTADISFIAFFLPFTLDYTVGQEQKQHRQRGFFRFDDGFS